MRIGMEDRPLPRNRKEPVNSNHMTMVTEFHGKSKKK